MMKLYQFRRYKQITNCMNTFMKKIYSKKITNGNTLDLYALAYSNLSWD